MDVQRNHPQRTPHSSTLSTMLIESRIYLLMSSMMCIASWCGRKEMDEIISVSMPFRRIQPLYLVQEPIRGARFDSVSWNKGSFQDLSC